MRCMIFQRSLSRLYHLLFAFSSHSDGARICSFVYREASFFVSFRDQETRFPVCAPEPVLSYSAKLAVFSFSTFDQLFQPSGLINDPISQFSQATFAYGLHGRPRKTLVTPSAAVSLQWLKTKPKGFPSGVLAAVTKESPLLCRTQPSNKTVASPKIKSVVPSM